MKKSYSIITIIFFTNFVIAQIPSLNWAKSIGGPNEDKSNSVTVDASGNVYTVGNFAGIADFDPGPGVFNLSGGYQMYISKLDADGNFLWAKTFLNVSSYTPLIKTDLTGDVFVLFNDSIKKLSPSGNIIWSKNLGAFPSNFTIDATDNIILSGSFSGLVDFNSGIGIDTLRGQSSVFILKLDNNGDFIWVKSIGRIADFTSGSPFLNTSSIAVNATGEVFVTGKFTGTVDFNPSAASYTLSTGFSGSSSLYILKLDNSGGFVWTKNTVGGYVWNSPSMVIDSSNNLYLTGSYESSVNFLGSTGLNNLYGGPSMQVFIAKFDQIGDIVWAKRVSSSNGAWGISVNIDASNNVYTMGQFTGTGNFNPGGSFPLTSTGGNAYSDIFITKFDNYGNFIWAENFGGPSDDVAYTMINDAIDNIYITGFYVNTCDFDPSVGSFSMTSVAGSSDGYVLKLGNSVIGVKELTKDNSLVIYPNPSNGVITIKSINEENYQLINNLGQTIKSIHFNSNNNLTVTIDELQSGIYNLVGKENNLRVSQKIIVIK